MSAKGPVTIIGAGIAGIAMSEALLRRGIEDFVILEKAASPGGVWRENVYPGVACDVPADNYAFRFAPNPDWSRRLAPGAEINAYLSRVFDGLGLRARARFGAEVTACHWTGADWRIEIAGQGPIRAASVICATGVLRDPKSPEILGLDRFGPVLHTANWQEDVPIDGRRVGIVGTGASAVQVIPDLARRASHLTIFMRSPPWIIPLPATFGLPVLRRVFRAIPRLYDAYRRISDEALVRAYAGIFLGKSPLTRAAFRTASRLSLLTVRDRDLRRTLRPDYPLGAKRMLYSTEFYRAVQRSNVSLVTDPITCAAPAEIRTGMGAHGLDTLVLATGFRAETFHRPIRVEGPGGVTIEDIWGDTPFAFRGVMLPGIPAFYMLLGPSSPIANTSNSHVAEWQAGYIAACIAEDDRTDAALMPTLAAARSQREIDDRAARKSVWMRPGAQNWYRSTCGTLMFSARRPAAVRRELRRPDWSEFTRLQRGPTASQIS